MMCDGDTFWLSYSLFKNNRLSIKNQFLLLLLLLLLFFRIVLRVNSAMMHLAKVIRVVRGLIELINFSLD